MPRKGVTGAIQDTKSHRNECANLLLFIDSNLPDNPPGQDGQDDVEGARVYCRRRQLCYSHRGGLLLTTSEHGIVLDDVKGPAGPRHPPCPKLRNGPALNPHHGSCKAKDEVHRDDNKPDKPPDPSVGEAEEGDTERRLAPRGRHGGTEAGAVTHLVEVRNGRIVGHFIPVMSQSGLHGFGEHGRRDEDGELAVTVGVSMIETHKGSGFPDSYPAANQEMVVPPERASPCELAVEAQGKENGRGDSEGPDGPVQARTVIHDRPLDQQMPGVHLVQDRFEPHGDRRRELVRRVRARVQSRRSLDLGRAGVRCVIDMEMNVTGGR